MKFICLTATKLQAGKASGTDGCTINKALGTKSNKGHSQKAHNLDLTCIPAKYKIDLIISKGTFSGKGRGTKKIMVHLRNLI